MLKIVLRLDNNNTSENFRSSLQLLLTGLQQNKKYQTVNPVNFLSFTPSNVSTISKNALNKVTTLKNCSRISGRKVVHRHIKKKHIIAKQTHSSLINNK